MNKRMRRRGLWLGFAVAVPAIAAAVVLLAGDRDRIKVAGLKVEPSSTAANAPVSITIENTANTVTLDSFSTPLSPVYRVEGSSPRRGAFTLWFSLPKRLRPEERKRVVAATKEGDAREWTVLPGKVSGNHLQVKTTHLSEWQLRLPKIDLRRASLESIERSLGARARPPVCNQRPDGLQLHIHDPSGILLGPCLAQVGERVVLKIANNRAVGAEFDLPTGAKVISTSSRSLGETGWDAIYEVALPGDQKMLPGAGATAIALEELPTELKLRATNSAIVLDALVDLGARANGAKAAQGARFLNGVRCLHVASQEVPSRWDNATDLLDSLRTVATDCLNLLVSDVTTTARLALALPKLAYSLWDSVRVVVDSPATITVSVLPQRLLPTVTQSEDEVGMPGVSCGVVEDIIPRTEYAIAAQIVVDRGTLACLRAREIIHDYIVADNPCVDAGNTCVLDLRGWRCAAPTAGSFPRVVSCSRPNTHLHVLGLDARSTLPRGNPRNCGTEPGTEIPGPFEVEANISCISAQRVARSSLFGGCRERHGATCVAFGFKCSTNHLYDYVYESTCALGRAKVHYEQGD